MSDNTPVIEVLEMHREEVAATGADVSVLLADAKFFSGNAALQQAGEVRKLVEALVAAGVAESDVGIESVRVTAGKGMLLRTSSASYVLAVRCREPNKVSAVIDALAAVKNSSLSNVTWRYDVSDSVRQGWLATCVQRARGSADAMAKALGTQVKGVHRIVDETYGSPSSRLPGHDDYSYRAGSAAPGMKRMRVEDTLEGIELAPKEEKVVRVRVWFAIG